MRESIVRVDPFGCTQRSCGRLIRHDYVTLGPHHMWHIDGHHKLIRYELLTHGGVDMFKSSYLITGVLINYLYYTLT